MRGMRACGMARRNATVIRVVCEGELVSCADTASEQTRMRVARSDIHLRELYTHAKTEHSATASPSVTNSGMQFRLLQS